MCDLAMISAGGDAVEIGRVSCFLSAVMGFAPLIFWGNKNAEIEEQKQGEHEDGQQIPDENEPERDMFRMFDDHYVEDNQRDELDIHNKDDANLCMEDAGLSDLLLRCDKVWEKARDSKTLLQHWVRISLTPSV